MIGQVITCVHDKSTSKFHACVGMHVAITETGTSKLESKAASKATSKLKSSFASKAVS